MDTKMAEYEHVQRGGLKLKGDSGVKKWDFSPEIYQPVAKFRYLIVR